MTATVGAPHPTMFVLVGPNGAGKTTFYRSRLQRIVDAEFVNADELAIKAFGHVATTHEQSAEGQRLAEERRRELLAAGRSLVVETTFSHPSKLELLRDARAAGFRIFVYHLNVEDADMAVRRVSGRVAQGGHPAPEERIRARYERNQPLIREAVLTADRGYVFDSSAVGRQPQHLITFADGQPIHLADDLPDWVIVLYGGDLP
jgi:predicted ABC-type ATPase